METLQFTTQIRAPREKVWDVLWQDDSYRKWTAVFHEGSYAESDWQEGGKVRFLGPGGDGMFGVIKKKVDHETMQFEHHGEIKGGQEFTQDWGGATESYFLKEADGGTELTVHLDATGEFKEYFEKTFPKAMERVKELAEA